MSKVLSLTARQCSELKDVLEHLIDHETTPDYASTMAEILEKLTKESKPKAEPVTGSGGITLPVPNVGQ